MDLNSVENGRFGRLSEGLFASLVRSYRAHVFSVGACVSFCVHAQAGRIVIPVNDPAYPHVRQVVIQDGPILASDGKEVAGLWRPATGSLECRRTNLAACWAHELCHAMSQGKDSCHDRLGAVVDGSDLRESFYFPFAKR